MNFFNNYQLAELVNENAKTQPNPEQFIAKELPTNKTLAFLNIKLKQKTITQNSYRKMIDKINELKLELTETLSTLKKIFNIYQTLCTTDKANQHYNRTICDGKNRPQKTS